MPMKRPANQLPGQPSQRQLRVAELIRHSVSEILTRGDVMDPELAMISLTIPEVRMSPDLKMATVYILPLGGGDPQPALKALERNKKWLRTHVAHKVNLKFAADLRFRYDDRFIEATRMDALIHNVAKDLARIDAERAKAETTKELGTTDHDADIASDESSDA